MKQIYLVRHAKPETAPDQGSVCLGSRTDVPLGAEGIDQTLELAGFFREKKLTAAYCSTLSRSHQTASLLLKHSGHGQLPLHQVRDFCEVDAGIWDGMSFEQIMKEYPKEFEARGKALGRYVPPDGESLAMAGDRFWNAMERLGLLSPPPGEEEEQILIVAHGGVIQAFLCLLSGKDIDRLWDYNIPYVGVTILSQGRFDPLPRILTHAGRKAGRSMKKMNGFQKGVNLGGWISQFETYDRAHFDTFITEEDIRQIASLGFDHVRVPVDYVLFEEEDGTPKEDGFHYLDLCRQWCAQNGLHMLIDLHECYGYSFDPLKNLDREAFFYDQKLQTRFLDLWCRIAGHFAPWQEQIAFEPLNEVVLEQVADAWNRVASAFITKMRAIVSDSYLVIGGVCYSSVTSVPLLNIPVDDRIVYNFHCYEPLVFTHQGAYWVDRMPEDFRIGYPRELETYRQAADELKLSKELAGTINQVEVSQAGEEFFEAIFAPALKKSEEDQVPLYCGEYGVIDLADRQDTLRWLKDIHAVMDRHGIGRALWNYKEKDFGFSGAGFSDIREQFIKIL